MLLKSALKWNNYMMGKEGDSLNLVAKFSLDLKIQVRNRGVGNIFVRKEDSVQNWQDPMAHFSSEIYHLHLHR